MPQKSVSCDKTTNKHQILQVFITKWQLQLLWNFDNWNKENIFPSMEPT